MKKTLLHVIAVIIMLIAACVYFSPALSGDTLVQGDMQKSEAMAHQQRMAADSTGTIPNWNPSMFSGMPGYQTAVEPQNSIFTPLKSILIMRPLGLERHIGILWLYLIGFYVAMVALGCNPLLSLLGALAFGLGSYNIIIIEAGHVTKGWAMSMIAPILASMVLCLRSVTSGSDGKPSLQWRPIVWGLILFTISLGLQITFNHIQITFYTMLGGIIIGLTYMVYALKDKWFKSFLCIVALLLVGCLFAVGGNYRHLSVNQEYQKYTMRGGSEISVKPHDLGLDELRQEQATSTGGLDINYAFSWSYGVGETYTILVPGAMGGGSGERVADDSEWTRLTGQHQAPLYWGDQPFTSGPVYFGAIIIFLFVFGCFVVKGPERWWIVIATIFAILLSWGRHFPALNGFLFNHLPLYNKFRTPSMALVLANVTMTIMAVLSLKTLSDNLQNASAKGNNVKDYDIRKRMNKALYSSVGIIAGILLVGIIMAKANLSFLGVGDNQYKQMLGDQWPRFEQILVDARRSLFVRDSLRSLLFVALAFLLLWLHINNKLKKSGILIASLALLVVFDLWGVDRRYLNEDNFTQPERVALRRTPTELQLDAVATANNDTDYRVFDLTVNTFNDSRPSAFHNEIGGYSAAKLRRYQDLIDFYLGSQKLYDYVNSCQIGMTGNAGDIPLLAVNEAYPVLDMLNARYLMLNLNQGATPVRRNSALGNCWLVSDVKWVDDANGEILALNDFNPATTAVVNRNEFSLSDIESAIDSNDRIALVPQHPYNPDRLCYSSHTSDTRLAIFSEVYYAPDWRAYIDGKPVDYIRANYILRAIELPAGDHTIEFVNEAPTLHRLDNITLIISIVMLCLMGGALFLVYRKKKDIAA